MIYQSGALANLFYINGVLFEVSKHGVYWYTKNILLEDVF